MKKVAFYTLGCKLNFSETSTLGRILSEKGFETSNFHDPTDVYVINTCSVTDNADKKCRKVIKEALKYNPNAYIVITGCYAQLKPAEITEIPGVDLVLGAAEKFNIGNHLTDLTKNGEKKAKMMAGPIHEANTFTAAYSVGERTRSFLKVQDGCDYSCSFCTIPLARGASRSDSIENVLAKATEIVGQGVKEIVLTGVNIGDYGKGIQGGKKKDANFLDLLLQLEELPGIERIRISSIEPNLLTDEIIQFVARSKVFVPHFHIPLQSGNNKILKAMRRRYLREVYEDRVHSIKEVMPQCCIGVDVIVGFPGETRADFLDTYQFLNELPISYLHVFTYSERENTLAITLPDRVPQQERNERSKMLHILSDKKRRAFYESMLKRQHTVLWEAENDNNWMYGFTENYVKVKMPYDPLLVNEVTPAILLLIDEDMTVQVEELVHYPTHH